MSGGGYFGNKFFPPGYFPDSYFGTEGESNPNAMQGVAAGLASASATLDAVGVLEGSAAGSAVVTGEIASSNQEIPVVVETVVLGGASKSKRTSDPQWIWRGAIIEIRADVVGSSIVSAEIVRHNAPLAQPSQAVSPEQIEDDDLEVMALISAFLAKVANVDRINGISL